MRLHLSLCSISFLLLLTGCPPQHPNAGQEGFPCRTGFAANWACNDGLRCMGDDGCVACGDPGEICCFESQTEVCHGAGVACENGNNPYDEQVGVCTASCGSIGLPCCPDGCPGSGECAGTMCEAPIAADPCFDPTGKVTTTAYRIWPDCLYEPVTFQTHSVEQAKLCHEALVAAAPPGFEICPLGEVPQEHALCSEFQDNEASLQYWTCSEAQLELCKQSYCFDGCTWTDGECP